MQPSKPGGVVAGPRAKRTPPWRACTWHWLLALPMAGVMPPAIAHVYEARLAQRALVGGSFTVGVQRWSCMGTLLRCRGELAQPAPSVSACQALAGRVGAIAAFGRVDGAQLRADELVACNLHAREQPPAGLPPRNRP